MILALINRLSGWNPQLFRELKGQFKPQNLAHTIATSLIFQGGLVLFYRERNNWQEWWLHLFQVMSWILLLILLVGGVGMLIADMAKEERRGTLNFIRLSPESSESILIGKMLGVPALIYLGVALAIPLHLVSALGAGVPLSFLFSFYLLIGVACCFFYSLALLNIFVKGSQAWDQPQAWAGCVLTGLCTVMSLGTMFSYLHWSSFFYQSPIHEWQWFHLPIGRNVATVHGFIILSLCLWTYLIWNSLNRRFRSPNTTLISKQQSYWSVACLEMWLVGFFVIERSTSGSNEFKGELQVILLALIFINLMWFLFLIAALSPHRQALQDWSRYRHKQNTDVRSQSPEEVLNSNFRLQMPSVCQDLIWGEKSPAVVAIGINLAITAAIYLPWILMWPADTGKFRAITSFVLSLSLILIYSLIAQLMLLLKTKKRAMLAFNAVAFAILAPPLLLILLSIDPKVQSVVWLLSTGAWPALQYASAMSVFLAFLGQLTVISLLSLQLTRQLRKAGESASKPLLTSSPS
ncbi:hypothetical protein [Microcoleus sp. FACHB-672]|uniref:hypothetical protein n=1 Tax=Microcoleus sp. FACHB-672 TaxID=2692825 RepID=UPI00168722D3|nr:hypothetical protein [Microcoleus sp. FACHB-672]MBD2042466.1 hypothetical protein [Microcoleus sp. FACHB-672]